MSFAAAGPPGAFGAPASIPEPAFTERLLKELSRKLSRSAARLRAAGCTRC